MPQAKSGAAISPWSGGFIAAGRSCARRPQRTVGARDEIALRLLERKRRASARARRPSRIVAPPAQIPESSAAPGTGAPRIAPSCSSSAAVFATLNFFSNRAR